MDNEIPKISVVIPTLNEEKYLAICLDSLKKQTFKNFETIVADGESTDHTLSIAKKYTDKIFVVCKSNVCKNRETGMRNSSSNLIVCMDADTCYPPNYIETVYSEFQKDKGVVAVCGMSKFLDGPWWGKLMFNILYKTISSIYHLTGYVIYTPAHALSFKKDAFIKLGGYNTNLDFGGDELDVMRRLKKVGKIVFNNDLMPKTSARRLKRGIFSLIYHITVYYWFNYLSARLLGKAILKAKEVR